MQLCNLTVKLGLFLFLVAASTIFPFAFAQSDNTPADEELRQVFARVNDDIQKQQFRQDLFDASNRDELVQALLAPSPDITASSQAISSEAQAIEDEEDENSDEPGDNT